MVKRVGRYNIQSTLGQGTFGKVKLAINADTGEQVAIKILDKEKIQKQNMGSQIKKEISIMKMVRHDHVVQLYEVLASRSKIFIVLELISGGELFDKIVREGRFSEPLARSYFRELLNGVKYCHTQGVCHRDLKPENLLLDADGHLKISDFGLSALYTASTDDGNSRQTLLHTTCGTPNYVAPEVLNDRGYDGRAADVWSMGVILYVLLAGFLPFDEPLMSTLFRKIQKAEFDYPSWFSPEVRAMLNKILVTDPAKRIGLAEIEREPWYITGESILPKRGSASADSADSASASGDGAAAAGKAVKHVPSAADMAGAIAPAAASGAGKLGEEEEEEDSKVKLLNAFDVVCMFGGRHLRRMLHVPGAKNAHRPSQFLSHATPDTILTTIDKALTAQECTTAVDKSNFHITARKLTPKGEISIEVRIANLSHAFHIVEVVRGRGDLLEYSAIYDELMLECDSLVFDGSTPGALALAKQTAALQAASKGVTAAATGAGAGGSGASGAGGGAGASGAAGSNHGGRSFIL